jgi:hypothetical protein
MAKPDTRWAVWARAICARCGWDKDVHVGPIDMAWPSECRRCGEMAVTLHHPLVAWVL